MNRKSFFLVPKAPFRLDLTAWTLRRRPDNLVDRWDGQSYRRVLPLAGGAVEISARQIGEPATPKLRIAVSGQSLPADVKGTVAPIIQRLLGANVDMSGFYRFALQHKALNALAAKFEGMKPPRFASIFEGLINAIACQQLTLTFGIELLNRLARSYGQAFDDGEDVAYAFPRPDDLVKATPETLRGMGFSRQKGRAIIELSRAIVEEGLNLELLESLPDEAALAQLQHLRGIGRWTAEYVLLRGFGRVHIFPGDDVGARNNLQKWLRLKTSLDYEGVARVLRRWHDFGGLIYFHLLLGRLAEAGYFQETFHGKRIQSR
jgi:DNA-3-methyladenine glycosylase II